MLSRIKFPSFGLYPWLRQCEVYFEQLDNARKLAVLSAVIAAMFIGWHVALQDMLAGWSERSRARVYELKTDEEVTKRQLERFERFKAENKLVSANEYRNKMSGRTAVSTGLGQWGEQYGLFLKSSEQQGDSLTLKFVGTYLATMKFFEQLANEADGLVAFKNFNYQTSDDSSSGNFATIELQVVLGR